MEVVASRIIETKDSETFRVLYDGNDDSQSFLYRDVLAVLPGPQKNGTKSQTYRLLILQTRFLKNQDSGESGPSNSYSVEEVLIRDIPNTFQNAYLLAETPKHLPRLHGSAKAVEFTVIVSTRSGLCEAENFYKGAVRGVLTAMGYSERDYNLIHTTSDKSVTEFAEKTLLRKASAGIAQTVLLLSGDGGVIDIVNGLLSTALSSNYVKPTIGLLALGTGNALANSSGLNQDSTRGLSAFLRGRSKVIPTFEAKFSPGSLLLMDEERRREDIPTRSGENGIIYGAVVGSWGLHASLVADSDTAQYRKYGRERFSMAANELLSPSDGSAPHVYKGRISSIFFRGDKGVISRPWNRTEHMYVLVTMVSQLQAGFRISPESAPLDGKMRVVHFGEMTAAEVKRVLGLAYAGGKHVHEPSISYSVVDGIRIEFEEESARWRRVCIDGKIVLVERGGWVEITRKESNVVDLVIPVDK